MSTCIIININHEIKKAQILITYLNKIEKTKHLNIQVLAVFWMSMSFIVNRYSDLSRWTVYGVRPHIGPFHKYMIFFYFLFF